MSNLVKQKLLDSKESNLRSTGGFTLLELMIVISIITIIASVFLTLYLSTSRMFNVTEAKTVTQDSSRVVMMSIVKELRQADASHITIDGVTGALNYVIASDSDGNGWPINSSGSIEWSKPRSILIDVDDYNDDGLTMTQLIREEVTLDEDDNFVSREVKVLTSNLSPVGGITFNLVGDDSSSILISILTSQDSEPNTGREIEVTSRLTETVTPRN